MTAGPDRLRVAVALEQLWHDVPGGTATSALGQARALQARHDLELIGVAARHEGPPAPAFRSPIPVEHLGLPRLALYETWHRLRWPRVERATGPVDVIHATGVAVPPASAPLVVTVHDLAPVHHPEMFTAKGRAFFAAAHRLARRDADLVLVPSEATRADCEAQGFPADRLRVVPWGVHVPAAPPTAQEVETVRRRHGLPEGYLLHVGTIEPRKGIPTLLDALARLDRPDVHLALAGPSGWHEDLGAAVALVAERCHLLGFVPAEDLPALYAGAAAFCYPSVLEGFGLPVLEAMAQGAPVVTSAGSAMAEVVGEAGLLVPPGQPSDLADAIGGLLDDPAGASRLGDAGRERARTFTWQRTADLTAAAYHEVAR
jgi:glycosyltransferase involved in cell wall biosynthesis